MTTFHDADQLRDELRRHRGSRSLIVAIDGASGSGKTTLASAISSDADAVCVSTDSYYRAREYGNRYVDGLDTDALARDLAAFKAGLYALIVVEGIAVRDTLDVMEHDVDIHVYCKRISSAGLWHDDPEFDSPRNSTFAPSSRQMRIDAYSREYHLRTEPHLHATFVFERVED